jgi:hypothetical protein
MATATYSATLFSRKYNASGNYLSDRAGQGAYASTGNLVGICNFKTLDMTNKVITGITFITTCISEAGAGNWATKTLKFRESTVANPTTGTGGTGSSFVGGTLGNLSGTNFYSASNISRPVDAASTLFARLKAYLEGGGHTLVLYAGDSTPSSGYSDNYLYLDALKIVVTYEEGLVYYATDGAFQKCQIYWASNGVWVQCVPYYGAAKRWTRFST